MRQSERHAPRTAVAVNSDCALVDPNDFSHLRLQAWVGDLLLRGEPLAALAARSCWCCSESKPPLQRCQVAWLDGLPPSSVPQVELHHAFIKVGQPGSTPCHPSQEISDHIEAAPSALACEPDFEKRCHEKRDELSVNAALEAPEQPAHVALAGLHGRPALIRCRPLARR